MKHFQAFSGIILQLILSLCICSLWYVHLWILTVRNASIGLNICVNPVPVKSSLCIHPVLTSLDIMMLEIYQQSKLYNHQRTLITPTDISYQSVLTTHIHCEGTTAISLGLEVCKSGLRSSTYGNWWSIFHFHSQSQCSFRFLSEDMLLRYKEALVSIRECTTSTWICAWFLLFFHINYEKWGEIISNLWLQF